MSYGQLLVKPPIPGYVTQEDYDRDLEGSSQLYGRCLDQVDRGTTATISAGLVALVAGGLLGVLAGRAMR